MTLIPSLKKKTSFTYSSTNTVCREDSSKYRYNLCQDLDKKVPKFDVYDSFNIR